MDASLIWYRARSDGSLITAIKNLLDSLDAVITGETTTINPTIVPALLAESLKTSDITVIIGGMDIIREDENIINILSRCLALKLETDEQSRSNYIYDSIRGRILPTFESAVLFPSANGGPEGMMLSSGEKIILLLPWMERKHMDIITMMKTYLPQLLNPHASKEDAAEQDPELSEAPEKDKNALPDYIERAAAKHRPAPVTPDEELNVIQLKDRLAARDPDAFIPRDPMPRQNTVRPKTRQSSAVTAQDEYIPDMVKSARQRSAQTLTFRLLSIFLLLAVIGSSCYIAFNHYEPGLIPDTELYQSELAELYTDSGDPSILPSLALPQFAQLYAANPDTRGFLHIPGTDISLPVVQTSGTDIDKYEEMDFYGNADARGTLYFDSSNRIVFGADNSNLVIYGNSPIDGSMFASLKNYTSADFLAEHPVIHMDTLYEESKWLVFSVCIVSQNTIREFNYANTVFAGQNARESHLHNLYVRSLFYTETEVFPSDKILTLVADNDEFAGAKLLVCARKLRADEDAPAKKTNVIVNELVLMPDIWYEINGSHSSAVQSFATAATRDTITVPLVTDENGDKVYVYGSTAAGASTAATDANGSAISASPTTASTTFTPPAVLPDMRITSGGKVITGSAAEVLAMIIEAEMGSDYSTEALKAQAVAAYTYYLYSGGSAKAPSFPTKTPETKALEAAAAVAGQYMTYKNNVPYTPYFAISAGQTADNNDINGSELPYLVSVDSSVDKNVSGYCVVKEVSSLEIASRVYEKKGIDLTAIEDKNKWFTILERDANGLYVTAVDVGGTTFKGNTLHLSILGYTCLRSPCFDIEYNEENDKFIFTSYGYGSGVGMSQAGANEYAKQGHDYIWILRHFYPGVEFSTGN